MSWNQWANWGEKNALLNGSYFTPFTTGDGTLVGIINDVHFLRQNRSPAYPIGSMGLACLPTFTIKINHPCRYIYQSHGSYGYGSVWSGNPLRFAQTKIKFVNRLVCLDLLHFSPSYAVRHISLDDASILQQQKRCFAASFFGWPQVMQDFCHRIVQNLDWDSTFLLVKISKCLMEFVPSHNHRF